jgi:anti-sigma B factor antagonist
MTQSAGHNASIRSTAPTDRGGYVIVTLGGELDAASAPALREQLRSLVRNASHLIIDLSAVQHVDASGLAVLVSIRRHARLVGGSLRLAALSPEVAVIVSRTGMSRHLDIFPTVSAAITGQPGLLKQVFPSAAVPAGGRFDDIAAGGLPNGSTGTLWPRSRQALTPHPEAGSRPGPGGPAKACAMAIHPVAAGPSMARARSSRCLR